MGAGSDEERLRRKRFRRDKRFKCYTIGAVLVAVAFIGFFLFDLIRTGASAFWHAKVHTEIRYTEQAAGFGKMAFPEETRELVSRGRMRLIPREMERDPRAEIRVRLPATRSRDAAESSIPWERITWPSAADAGVTAEAALLRSLIGEAGRDEIRTRWQKKGPDGGGARWVLAAPAVDRYVAAKRSEEKLTEAEATGLALAPARRRQVDALLEAGLIRRKYNERIGTVVDAWVTASSDVDQYVKGKHSRLDEDAKARVDALREQGRIRTRFNWNFFTNGNSKLPEMAGIKSAAVGSVLTMALVLAFTFPVGVLTAIYLEEFAPDNKLTQTIEVNINNLAAVPSILFGLLGLAAFVNFFALPRSSALVGALTLSLMTLPIVIISSRAALRAVPDSIRLGAMSMGATRWQAVCHHVLPQSISGMLTGTIIGLAQAMGETAPLIMIGMVAFIPSMATGVTDPTTALPAQIYLWSTESQRGFVELTAAAILVLLAVLFAMNALGVLLRARYERRW